MRIHGDHHVMQPLRDQPVAAEPRLQIPRRRSFAQLKYQARRLAKRGDAALLRQQDHARGRQQVIQILEDDPAGPLIAPGSRRKNSDFRGWRVETESMHCLQVIVAPTAERRSPPISDHVKAIGECSPEQAAALFYPDLHGPAIGPKRNQMIAELLSHPVRSTAAKLSSPSGGRL